MQKLNINANVFKAVLSVLKYDLMTGGMAALEKRRESNTVGNYPNFTSVVFIGAFLRQRDINVERSLCRPQAF